ncbi:MAG: TIGR01458 family HAD-type hydrolase, partial [Methanomicrobium sp.]|nr:TIGR01458 family HAD-type hydrolase [Methanomicrobium sp.]
MNEVSGILFDIDGVLYSGGKAVQGASNALNLIADAGIPFRCLSNTTRSSSLTISQKLNDYGFFIPKEHIITPAVAVSKILNEMEIKKCFFLITGDVTADFKNAGLISDENN